MTEIPITTIAKALADMINSARGECITFTCHSLLKYYGIYDTDAICRRAAVLFRALAEMGYLRIIDYAPRLRIQVCRYDELWQGHWVNIYTTMVNAFESYVCKKALTNYKIT